MIHIIEIAKDGKHMTVHVPSVNVEDFVARYEEAGFVCRVVRAADHAILKKQQQEE